MLTANLDIPLDQIRDFCTRWKITEFALFGSVLRDDFRPDSDVDVLVSFEPDAEWDYSVGWPQMIDELESLFARKVDLVEKQTVTNPFRRSEILATHAVLHPAPSRGSGQKNLAHGEAVGLPNTPDPGSPGRGARIQRDPALLFDILHAATRARSSANTSFQEFAINELLVPATEMYVIRIGRYMQKLAPSFRQNHPHIRWQHIIDFSDALVTDYNNVSLPALWEIATTDLPQLIALLEPLPVLTSSN